MDKDFEVVIAGACRTPIGAFGGAFKDLAAVDLGAIVIREAIARAGVKPEDVGDAVMGCVLQAGAGMNVARQAGLKAGLPVSVPGETVNRVCGSGLQAVVHAVEAIRVGYVDTIVAGGTESMSNAPYLLKGARWGYRMGNGEAIDSMLHEGLTCAIAMCHMGITAEEVADRYRVPRADQDAFAAESQQRAVRAIGDGRFKAEIVPVPVPQKKGSPVIVDTDEYPRPGTTAETLAALKPAFKKDGSVTAGNASGINDGAAAMVVMTMKKAQAIGVKPLARILSYVSTGVDPKIHGYRTDPGRPQGTRTCRFEDGGCRFVRAQRSVCGAVDRRGPRARSRQLEGQRERRCDCARPPDRSERRSRADDVDLCASRAEAALRRGVSLHRWWNGHRDGGRSALTLAKSQVSSLKCQVSRLT